MVEIQPIIRLLLRIIIGGLFIYAGAIKALNPEAFAVDIESYRLLPSWMVYLLALYLPFLELVCGGLLIFDKFSLPVLTILTALMVAFTIAIVSAWMRGLDISCGCFGKSSVETNYPWLISRDLLILGSVIFLLIKESQTKACSSS